RRLPLPTRRPRLLPARPSVLPASTGHASCTARLPLGPSLHRHLRIAIPARAPREGGTATAPARRRVPRGCCAPSRYAPLRCREASRLAAALAVRPSGTTTALRMRAARGCDSVSIQHAVVAVPLPQKRETAPSSRHPLDIVPACA